MAINGITKGKEGEREVCLILNTIVNEVYAYHGLPAPAVPVFQRNQNQSAVGGSDIKNPFMLAVEVKRQEALSINTWWKQLERAATRDREWPILIFKQNHKPWRVMMPGSLPRSEDAGVNPLVRVEIDLTTFQVWVRTYLDDRIRKLNNIPAIGKQVHQPLAVGVQGV